MAQKYVIGIDLGTTNSSLAYAGAESVRDPHQLPEVSLFGIPQLVNPGEVREEGLLPSSLFLPGAADFPPGSLTLPWEDDPAFVVGRLAARRGVESSGRLVSSAKSWLSHSGVDRTKPILPVNAPEDGRRVSPVEASRRYLEHLRFAWDSKMPDAPFVEQQMLVTVPASFDAIARDLTQRARRRGRLPQTWSCSKNPRPPSTPGSNATPTGASASPSATSSWWSGHRRRHH